MQSVGAEMPFAIGTGLLRPGLRHARVLAGLVLAVLLAHLALLGGVEYQVVPTPQPSPAAVQVRSIVPAPPAAPPGIRQVGTAPAAPPTAREKRPVSGRRPPAEAAAARAEVASQAALVETSAGPATRMPLDVPVAAVPQTQASTPASTAMVDPPVVLSIAAAEPARGAEWPVYATRLSPSITLRYQLSRGALTGSGELRWLLDGARYRLQLDGAVLGVNVLTQTSEGAIDAAGVAPLRFTDQRARRSPQAANFQREAGKVTFSGPSLELPLVPGVQDRLSWMIQLAAVVDADPLRWLDPSQPITLQVVGARGDSAAWVFHWVGPASLQLPEGSVQTLHFRREPRGPYETTVDVWLDPQRHHLPVRALQRSAGEGDGFELRLREAVPVP